MPPRFHTLIAAQFFSALADNALLILAVGLLQRQGLPPWWAPLLKLCFNAAYVGLAPVVGLVADAWPKVQVLGAMNGLKALGVLALLAGLPALPAFAIVGMAAAAYAPAKYGLITEMVPPALLVRANAWIEVSVVSAVLLGTTLGGLLQSPWWLGLAPLQALAPLGQSLGLGQEALLLGSWCLLLALYGLAALLQLRVPDSGVRYASPPRALGAVLADFHAANRSLWQDRQGGRLSLAVTTLFWGAGASLQLAVLQWSQSHLGLRLDQGAYLQAVVALGVILGALLAARWVPMAQVRRVLPLGLLMGLALLGAAWISHWLAALPAMVLVGALGGALLVPMNALLQHRGHQLLSAGRSIAVQGFNENLSILLMLAAYAGVQSQGLPLPLMMSGLGLTLALAMLVVIRRAAR
jgi:MFS family permease